MEYGSIEAFERAKGLPKQSVRDVLRGRAVRRTADVVAAAMGLPIGDLFPGRFINPENTARKRDLHRLNKKAA